MLSTKKEYTDYVFLLIIGYIYFLQINFQIINLKMLPVQITKN